MRITSGVRLCHSKPLFRRFKRQLENIRFELEGEASELETGVKDSIATQTCELSKEEFNDFLTLYPIPSEYHVILPKSNQTIFDALPGARLMVVSPLSTSSKGSSICVKLEPSPGFGTGSLSVLVNTEPLKADEELMIQPVKVTIDSRESLKPEVFVVHPRSVAARIKDRKCKTRGGLSRPPVMRKFAPRSSTSNATCAKTSSLKDDVPFLIVSDDDEGLPDVLKLKYATTATSRSLLLLLHIGRITWTTTWMWNCWIFMTAATQDKL
ncbi:hypothetical protein Tco_0033517 [Tanacetum coccineum]